MGRIHARSLADEGNAAVLIAAADLDAEKAARCAEEFGAEGIYTDDEALLADDSIDAVLICTPGDTHAGIIEAAANAGKHIFCEKPIDWDLAAVDRALAAVEGAGVKLQIGFQRRFDREFQRAREAVASGKIGRPHVVHLISRDPVLPYAGPKAAGDIYFDSTIHDLDMARFLSGEEVESVVSLGAAMGGEEEGSGEDPDTTVTMLRFESGAIVSVDNSRQSATYDQRAEIFGPGGIISVENQPDAEGSGDDVPFFARRYFDAYAAELRAFVKCVRTGRQPEVTGDDGRSALVLAIAAHRSYREGRPLLPREVG
jgi:myo-inositol 2-dehydrogenase / D-chiro-inositol 1-dehydrogenase